MGWVTDTNPPCAQRIMIIDGAMGTVIQQYKLQVQSGLACRLLCAQHVSYVLTALGP